MFAAVQCVAWVWWLERMAAQVRPPEAGRSGRSTFLAVNFSTLTKKWEINIPSSKVCPPEARKSETRTFPEINFFTLVQVRPPEAEFLEHQASHLDSVFYFLLLPSLLPPFSPLSTTAQV